MRKGFSVTLATVAFAMLGFKATAMAPTIDAIPDIIVGDAENSSDANVFVFPNAIDLNAKVHDDDTSAAGIIWTFATSGGVYALNGATPVNIATDDLVNPPAAKRVDTQNDARDTDTNPRTVTVRDILRSPLPNLATYPAGSNGVTNSGTPPGTIIDSRVVTLYASDGSTMSLANGASFIVYTRDNGFDAYSPEFTPPNTVYGPKNFKTAAGRTGWVFSQTGGSATQSSGDGIGLCITVPAAGSNDGNWATPYGTGVQLTANSVWETRMTVTTTQTVQGLTPLFVMVYDNNGGQDEYGGEMFYLDNEGGANGPINPGTVGRSDFRVYMMPIQEQTPQFSDATNGFFTPTLDSANDMRLILRILDSGLGFGSELDTGTVCWTDILVNKWDLTADMVVDNANVFSVSSFVNAATTPGQPGSFQQDAAGDVTNLTFNAGGSVTLAPATSWANGYITLFRPGDFNVNLSGSGSTAVNVDNWPITWEADTTYYIEYLLSSPNAASEVDPPDAIRIGADVETSEILCDNFAVPNTPDLSGGGFTASSSRGVSMPRAGTPQKYGCFFFSHSITKSAIADSHRWRPRFEILGSGGLAPLGRTSSTHGITVNGVTVKKVHFRKP